MEPKAIHKHSRTEVVHFSGDLKEGGERSVYEDVANTMETPEHHDTTYEVFPVRNGLSLTVNRFCLDSPFLLDFEIAGSSIGFECWLRGSGECTLQGIGDSPSCFKGEAGTMISSYVPGTTGYCNPTGEGEISVVALCVDPELLHTMVGDDVASLPQDLGATCEGSIRHKFIVKESMAPEIQAVCHQILSCPFSGRFRDLYLESKALELLTLQLHTLSSTAGRMEKGLSPRELERVHHARDLLVCDLKKSTVHCLAGPPDRCQ